MEILSPVKLRDNIMRIAIISLIFTLFTAGCSVQKLAVNVTSGIFGYGIEAIYAEPDLGLAETAVGSNLKLLEGFHLAEPKNEKILFYLTQGFAAYALAFHEESDPERASLFYLRARDYGYKLLEKRGAFKNGVPQTEEAFKAAIAKMDKDDLGALFWTAFAWGGWVNLNRDDAQAVFDLGVVKAMMNRVLELDEGYFFGAAHLFFGSISGSIPRMLGGDPEKAREHFERAIALSGGKFLVTDVYMARYYAATTLNEELFDETLQKVLDAPMDINPGYELMTSLAKRQAASLKAQRDEIF